MSYSDFIFHRDQRAMASGQRAYDAQEPPEDDDDCKEDGHKWKRIPGCARDGTKFCKCVKCGMEAEQ